MWLTALGICVAVSAAEPALNGQSGTPAASSATNPAFDVTSIRPSAGGRSTLPTVRGRQLTAINVPLRPVIQMAYGQLVDGTLQQLLDSQLVGGPTWIESDRFDIVATLPEGPRAPGDLLLMIRSMLTRTFKLQVHTEAREVPIYALILARSDGRLGAGLRPLGDQCNAGSPADAAQRAGANCGLRAGPGKIAGRAPMRLLVSNIGLGRFLDRPVVDRTNLTGNFDVALQWIPTPDQMPDRLRGNTNIDQLLRNAGVSTDAPSLFTAVQEQLGLKLESQIGKVDVVVIDRIERPSEN